MNIKFVYRLPSIVFRQNSIEAESVISTSIANQELAIHFASLIGLFKSTDSIIVILIIVDDLCFKQFLDVSTISNLKKLNLVFPFLLFLYFFFDESKSRDPEIGIFLRQLSSQKELDPTPEPSGNLALGVICCSISLFTCLDLFCYLICKLLANYKNIRQ